MAVTSQDSKDAEETDSSLPIAKHLLSVAHALHFCLRFLTYFWVEPDTTTEIFSVAFVLPSGVGADHFFVRVMECSLEL